MIKIPILMYHKIDIPPPQAQKPALYVTPAEFRRQMEKIASWGYTFLNFHDLLPILDKTASPPKKGVIITFDDGFANNHTHAFPVLKEMKIKATIFLVSDNLGNKSKWLDSQSADAEELLTIKHIEEMKNGAVSFQAHSKTHTRLDKVSGPALSEEVHLCGKEIHKITGEKQICFCYPYGNYNEEVIEEVKKAGYKMACSTKRENRYTEKDRFILPRVPVHLDTSIQKLKYRLGFLYHMEHLF